jgi:hypothetical protein
VTFQDDAPPDVTYGWDDFKAADLIGKHVLVGISYLDAAGSPIKQRQLRSGTSRAFVGICLFGV